MAIKIQGVTVISDTQDLTITGYANFSGTGAIKVPVGTDGQRPTAATGQIRFNSTSNTFEGYNGTAWSGFGGTDETARTLATLALDSAFLYSTTNVGNGVDTSYTVTHNMNRATVIVVAKDTGTGVLANPTVTVTSANAVQVVFGSAATLNQYAVTVVGIA
jgi:hypothetical protein